MKQSSVKKMDMPSLGNSSKWNYLVQLSLVQFKEGDITIIYSPALDLSGYGQSVPEAKKSFKEVLNEFFRYTLSHNTLDKQLIKLGWKKKGSKNISFIPPKNSDLVTKNKLFTEIVNTKSYKTTIEEVEIAV